MKRILIVGAGGFGREVLRWVEEAGALNSEWVLGGFLDDNPDSLNGYGYALGIVSSVKDYRPQAGEQLVLAIGSPRVKEQLAHDLEARGAEFLSLVHPSVTLGNNVRLGRGCVLCPGAVITCDVTVGDFVTLNVMAGLGHDAQVGDFTTLSSFSEVTGFGKLGRGVFMGSHATVLPGLEVGDAATVGAGSVVVKNVRAGTTVMGVPARKI